MKLIDCPACNHQISKAAISCPNCSHPINSVHSTNTSKEVVKGVGIVAALIAFIQSSQ